MSYSGMITQIFSYMRPNTPHAVLTPKASICHGGFFLSRSNIRATCYGHLMTFSMASIATNTNNSSDSQLLFRKMLAYFREICIKGEPRKEGKSELYSILKMTSVTLFYFTGPLATPDPHAPDVSTFDGIHDIFSLCNLVEMANILHPGTYSKEGLRAPERLEMIRGRALSRAVVAWVISNYETEDSEITIESFYWKYLAYQARAVCKAKDFRDLNNVFAFSGITLASQVRRLTELSFKGIESFWAEWNRLGDIEPEAFAWPESRPVAVKIRNTKLQGMRASKLMSKLTAH